MFKTRPDRDQYGDPFEARPCRCDRPWKDRDEPTCVRCGRLFRLVIRREWAATARRRHYEPARN